MRGGVRVGKQAIEDAKKEKDYEIFMRDLEEDPELRGMINLYKGISCIRHIHSLIDKIRELSKRRNGTME